MINLKALTPSVAKKENTCNRMKKEEVKNQFSDTHVHINISFTN